MANAYINASLALSDLTPSQKHVLLVMANRANEKSAVCISSLKTIALETCLSRSTVVRAIRDLIHKGVISKTSRNRSDGSQASNIYRFLIAPVESAEKVVRTIAEAIKGVFKDSKKVQSKTTGNKAPAGGKKTAPANLPTPKKKPLSLEDGTPDRLATESHILTKALELYPSAIPELVEQAIELHLDFWRDAQRKNPKLWVTLADLTGRFFVREKGFLEFASQSV